VCHNSLSTFLRIELLSRAGIRWRSNGWKTFQDADARNTGLGVRVADLPASEPSEETMPYFTSYWSLVDRWEGRNFKVSIKSSETGRNKA
jgi:glucoamylase